MRDKHLFAQTGVRHTEPTAPDDAVTGFPGSVDERFREVLVAARDGAEWAWAWIYDDLAPAVLGYLRQRGSPDPDGVCGDVFAQLVRDLHRFEGDHAGFRSWVFVMAHHRMLDDLRRRKRRPEAPTAPETMSAVVDGSDLEGGVVRRRMEAEVRAVLDELTPAQRDVLALRIFGGLRIEEIAKAVGRRPGAVKALQRRGIEVLRAKLADRGLYERSPEASPDDPTADLRYPDAAGER